MNSKFADDKEFEWMLGKASYNKKTGEWVQVGALIAEKNLTAERIEKELKSF